MVVAVQHCAKHSVLLYQRRASETISEGVDMEVYGKPSKIVEMIEQLV
jgi:hypothetical protein